MRLALLLWLCSLTSARFGFIGRHEGHVKTTFSLVHPNSLFPVLAYTPLHISWLTWDEDEGTSMVWDDAQLFFATTTPWNAATQVAVFDLARGPVYTWGWYGSAGQVEIYSIECTGRVVAADSICLRAVPYFLESSWKGDFGSNKTAVTTDGNIIFVATDQNELLIVNLCVSMEDEWSPNFAKVASFDFHIHALLWHADRLNFIATQGGLVFFGYFGGSLFQEQQRGPAVAWSGPNFHAMHASEETQEMCAFASNTETSSHVLCARVDTLATRRFTVPMNVHSVVALPPHGTTALLDYFKTTREPALYYDEVLGGAFRGQSPQEWAKTGRS